MYVIAKAFLPNSLRTDCSLDYFKRQRYVRVISTACFTKGKIYKIYKVTKFLLDGELVGVRLY